MDQLAIFRTHPSTLTGIAASNATLAWFGGGALAAEGLGIAGGAAVLGGIVVIPALIIYGVFNHVAANQEIEKIAKKEQELVKATSECHKMLTKLAYLDERSRELIQALKKSSSVFASELGKTYAELFGNPILNFWRHVRKLFTGRRFADPEIKKVNYVLSLATSLAKLIDQKLLDEHGTPI